MRLTIFALSALALAACDQAPVSGTRDSGVLRLTTGMSLAQARGMLGPQTAGDVRADANPNCITWVYNEAIEPQFIHAIFAGDSLVSARDGFAAPCPL